MGEFGFGTAAGGAALQENDFAAFQAAAGKCGRRLAFDPAHALYQRLTVGDTQVRWIGAEKGALQMAIGALVNTVWDLYARVVRKPVWQVFCDFSPEQFVKCVDLTYLTDCLTEAEALEMLRACQYGKQDNMARATGHDKASRMAFLEKNGYPAYITSAGWLGYSDEKMRTLLKKSVVEEDWDFVKLKVGATCDPK